MNTKENRTTNPKMEGRAELIEQLARTDIAEEDARPDFAARYIAIRYHLSAGCAALVARLAEIGGALA